MRARLKTIVALASLFALVGSSGAFADVQPSQSITHMKTTPGLVAALEAAGVIFYVQGGATSGVIGEMMSSENSQVVFHIPITGTKGGMQHVGSNIVLFNTATNSQVQLRNPIIDLQKGIVTATIPQASNQSITILNIANAASINAKQSFDKRTKIRSTTYAGAVLNLAPGVAATLVGLLGLPANSIADLAGFASADVTLKRVAKKS